MKVLVYVLIGLICLVGLGMVFIPGLGGHAGTIKDKITKAELEVKDVVESFDKG